jgi:hypothetical protein
MSLPTIVTGMHRSGTSLTASFIKAIGVDFGDNLLEGDRFNQKGYFEDVDFLEFQRSVLQKSCDLTDPGWHDWGWTQRETLDRRQFKKYELEARSLIENRPKNGVWGWKDPRTTLMLDFWHQLLPEARYLFVYRQPWDVADSILRLNSAIFSEHPDYALKAWVYYNRDLLQFYQKHRDRCILFNINSVLQQPERLVELLEDKLNFKLERRDRQRIFKQVFHPDLFKQLEPGHPFVQLLRTQLPEYEQLLQELDRNADIPSPFFQVAIPTETPLEKSAMLLHYRTLQVQMHQQAIAHQWEQEKQQLHVHIAQREAELAAVKGSRTWRAKEKVFQVKEAIASKLSVNLFANGKA